MTEDAYERIARIYVRVFDPMNAAVHAAVRKVHPPEEGMSVLDVGCGTGAQLSGYAAAGCVVTGLDLSPAMLGAARDRLGDAADLHLGDATNLPFADESFDLVLASLFLHELEAPTRNRVMTEMARVSKSDGRILVTDFAPRPRGLKGRALRAFSWVVEAAAGADHFREFRQFIAGGGIPGAADGTGLIIESSRRLAGANLAVYVATPSID